MSQIPRRVLDEAVEAFEKQSAAHPEKPLRQRLSVVLKTIGAAFPGDEFMGAAESAEELGVKSPNLRRTRGLPDPFGQVRSGPFWKADDIRTLAKRRDDANGD